MKSPEFMRVCFFSGDQVIQDTCVVSLLDSALNHTTKLFFKFSQDRRILRFWIVTYR